LVGRPLVAAAFGISIEGAVQTEMNADWIGSRRHPIFFLDSNRHLIITCGKVVVYVEKEGGARYERPSRTETRGLAPPE